MVVTEIKGTCAICEKSAELLCSGCEIASYCSQKHLKEHSAKHKLHCKPYKISSDENLGRFLVASRDIKQGEVILQEKPLVVGPGNGTLPICYACGGFPSSRCPNCRVALTCGPLCKGNLHGDDECQLYKDISQKLKSVNFITNELVLPLRCLFHLKENPKNEWNKFIGLESHKDKRRGSTIWRVYHKNIVQVFQEWGIISKEMKDEELLQEIMGILDVNSFEVRCGVHGQGRAVYLEAALMNHDCYANVQIAVDNNYLLTVKSRRNIPSGHPILYNYTNPLHTTHVRREHLLETKYFYCECKRCKDPTELGTHLSSLICPHCKEGLVTFNLEESGEEWKCIKCNYKYSQGLISTTMRLSKYTIDDLDKTDIAAVERAIRKLSKSLSRNHSMIIDLKQQLAVLYREKDVTLNILDKRKQLCLDILSVLNLLEPGISRLRGITLYELHTVLVSTAQLKKNNITELETAEEVLKEAVTLLLHEPPLSPEGSLAKQALAQLKELRHNIQQSEKRKNKKKN